MQNDDVGCAKRRREVGIVSDLNRRFAHRAEFGGQNPTLTTIDSQALYRVGFRTPYKLLLQPYSIELRLVKENTH